VFHQFSTAVHLQSNDVKQPARHFGLKQWRDELTSSRDDAKMARALISPTFHTHTGERLLNSRTPTSQDSVRSTFWVTFESLTYILVGRLVGGPLCGFCRGGD